MDRFVGKWEVVSAEKCDDFFTEAGILYNHILIFKLPCICVFCTYMRLQAIFLVKISWLF